MVSNNDPVLDALNHVPPDLFCAIGLIGVFLDGIIGGRLARTRHFDAADFMVLAVMFAFTDGMLRDVLLQPGPPAALTDPHRLGTALVGAGITILWKLDSGPWCITLIIMDGTVLGCWAATGTPKTLQASFGILPVTMLGVITAVGGGAIRDILAGNVLQVFGGNNLYAMPALVPSAIMVLFELRGLDTTGMFFAALVGSGFTALSHWRGWQPPQVSEWELSFTSFQLRFLLGERSLSVPRLVIYDACPSPNQINNEDFPSLADETSASSDDPPST